jgi:hypothetical protein
MPGQSDNTIDPGKVSPCAQVQATTAQYWSIDIAKRFEKVLAGGNYAQKVLDQVFTDSKSVWKSSDRQFRITA